MTTTTSRRAILAGAASLPALAAPAVADASVHDPIIAAIETHRVAWGEYNTRCSELDAANTPEGEAEWQQLYDAEAGAALQLFNTEPTTIVGAVALLRYVANFVECNRSSWSESWVDDAGRRQPPLWFLGHNLADALETIAGKAVRS
jgi:hypothetical protein